MVSANKIKLLSLVLNMLKMKGIICQIDKNNRRRFPIFYTKLSNEDQLKYCLQAIGFKFNEYVKAYIRNGGGELTLEHTAIEGKPGLFVKITVHSGVNEVGFASDYLRGEALLKSIQSKLPSGFTYIDTLNVLLFRRPTEVDVNDTTQKLAQLGFNHLADDKLKLDADTYNIKKQFSNGDDGLELDVSYKQSKPVSNMLISYKYCGNNKA